MTTQNKKGRNVHLSLLSQALVIPMFVIILGISLSINIIQARALDNVTESSTNSSVLTKHKIADPELYLKLNNDNTEIQIYDGSTEKTSPTDIVKKQSLINDKSFVFSNQSIQLANSKGEEEASAEVEESSTDVQDEEIPTEEEPTESRPVFEETEITGNEKIDYNKLCELVNTIAPELSGIEDAILEIYDTTGIKPFFQLAKFCLESGYGNSSLAHNKNNIAGWNAYACGKLSAYQHATSFETKSDCVLTVGNSIYNRYINSYGLTTIHGIASVYCPGNATHWTNQVKSIMSTLQVTYNNLA